MFICFVQSHSMSNEYHIHVLLQLYVKNAETILFLNAFPDNSLMRLDRNDCNFRASCKFGKSKIVKFLFSFLTKNRENFEIKRRDDILSRIFACHILGGLS